MTDYSRDKYSKLMREIDNLEDMISELENLPTESRESDKDKELLGLREQLAAKRNELARLSDGCGKPHPMG